MEDRQIKHGQRWGQWTLDMDVLVLRDRRGYEVDLERCDTPAKMLDFIMQVSSKAKTYSSEDVGDLVRALEEILQPQATICSFGRASALNVKKWMKQIEAGD